MATTKKAAPKKKAAAKKETPKNGDIVFSITVTTANGSKHSAEARITNPRGCMLPARVDDPAYIMGAFKTQLAARFGRNHVK